MTASVNAGVISHNDENTVERKSLETMCLTSCDEVFDNGTSVTSKSIYIVNLEYIWVLLV